MRVISVQQPWGHLICEAGKNIENRTWPTRYRGPVLIHAGQQLAPWPDGWSESLKSNLGIDLPALADLPRGGIIGIAEIVDSVQKSSSPWFTGPHGFVLRNQRPLPFFACKGKLGFFAPPPGYVVPTTDP